MKNITRHTGKLIITGRLPGSCYGNPRYSGYIDGVNFVTGVDSQHGYCIGNYEGREITVTIGTHYGRPTLNTIERDK